jgi:Tfp pilus assembly PilM family ATPase
VDDGSLMDMLIDRRRELMRIKFTRGMSTAEEKELAKIEAAIDVVEEAEAAIHLAGLENLVVEMEAVASRSGWKHPPRRSPS